MRMVAVLTVVFLGVCWALAGWRTAMLLLTGGAVSWASLFEWQRLVAVMNARLDNLQAPRSASSVVAMFLLRLMVAGAVLYGSLKCFQGPGYGPIAALAGGLCLAVIALGIEAFRMLIV